MAKLILNNRELKFLAKKHNTTMKMIKKLARQFSYSNYFVDNFDKYIESRK